MNCARTHLVAMMFVLAGLTWPANGQTSATRWKGFNSEAALDRTARQTAPDIRTILEDDLPRVLTSEERAKLSDVRIEFPREDSSHPMNFSSNWRDKRITAPVSSLRFLRDMVVAYAWLSAKGYDLQSVTDYLCMIKYQWPDRLRGDPALQFLDLVALELDDLSGVDVDHVVVVFAAIEFVDGVPAFEIVLEHQSGRLELGQHPIHRGQADFVAMLQQLAIDVLGGHMTRLDLLQQLEDLHPRVRDLEPGLAQFLRFHRGSGACRAVTLRSGKPCAQRR